MNELPHVCSPDTAWKVGRGHSRRNLSKPGSHVPVVLQVVPAATAADLLNGKRQLPEPPEEKHES